ncbi:MAG: TlpA family protein disulfide reductase [Armatimonadetes bacterium]|nr:TlpA family protein disulfide reductase [Armatimonadota bacterium]
MYNQFNAQGLEILAVNGFDKQDVIEKYIKDNSFTFPVILAGDGQSQQYALATAYGVEAYPTNYLIDAEGKVVFRSVGFSEAGLKAALAKLGIK